MVMMLTVSPTSVLPLTTIFCATRKQQSVRLWTYIMFKQLPLNWNTVRAVYEIRHFNPLFEQTKETKRLSEPLLLVTHGASVLPVCRGTVICSLQSALTTALPPLSSCLTIGPSSGSFSILSLTSCKQPENKPLWVISILRRQSVFELPGTAVCCCLQRERPKKNKN